LEGQGEVVVIEMNEERYYNESFPCGNAIVVGFCGYFGVKWFYDYVIDVEACRDIRTNSVHAEA
jgi:hypothetical protein